MRYWAAGLAGAFLSLAGCARAPEVATPRLVAVPAEASGLRYRWSLPGPRPCTILGTIGNGCAFFDFDTDGNLDILLVGATPALFRGDGKGRFTKMAAKALGSGPGHFLGCAVGDYDNDGFSDLYLSGYGEGRLLRNEGGRRFVDVSHLAGIGRLPWGSGAAFVDLDGDGYLDLVVGNYIDFGPRHRQYCPQGGIDLACSPIDYFAVKPVVYRNRGDGAFVAMDAAWQVTERTGGKALGVAAADFDGSGRPAVYLANDQVPGDLIRLEGGRFQALGTPAGVAYAASGARQAGMGTDWGDYDNDGWLDLAVATYADEVKPIYQNQGNGLFREQSAALGVAAPLMPSVSFGVKWIDVDNDGWLDLLYANGHIADNIQAHLPAQRFRQPAALLHNQGGSRFQAVDSPALRRPLVGRGIATGDYDNDGRVDALLVDSDGEPVLLHNETPRAGNYLSVRLIGVRGGRDAYGAQVTVEAQGRRWVRHCHADGSYLSSSDPRLHFGLGAVSRVDRLRVRWPDGAVTVREGIAVNGPVRITEGS